MCLVILISCGKKQTNISEEIDDEIKKYDKLKDGYLIVGEDYPPYSMLDGDKWIGHDPDLIYEAAKIAGIKVHLKLAPWKRCIHMVKTGEADAIFSLFETKERREFLYFPKPPLAIEKNLFWANKHYVGDVKKISDIKGKEIGVMGGYSYGPMFDNYKDYKSVPATTQEMHIKRIVYNRTNLIINNELVTYYMLKQLNISNDKIRPLSLVVDQSPLYLGISKKSPYGKMLYQKFSDALLKLKKSGKDAQIWKKYL